MTSWKVGCYEKGSIPNSTGVFMNDASSHLWKPLGFWIYRGLDWGHTAGQLYTCGWMASPTRWGWVWVNSGSWWWTGRPGVLQFMGLQRVWHDWATELTDWQVMYADCICPFLISLINLWTHGNFGVCICHRDWPWALYITYERRYSTRLSTTQGPQDDKHCPSLLKLNCPLQCALWLCFGCITKLRIYIAIYKL